mmetsp:Transcript_119595/g.334960  ORF Transcript_119595/g.334960 Transcript_119595/m.334960 type:complete len:217 (+) Transcript_119595:962-1612(+)
MPELRCKISRAGRVAQSKANITEEPIHCCGTGAARQASTKAANCCTQVRSTTSWVSTMESTLGSSAAAGGLQSPCRFAYEELEASWSSRKWDTNCEAVMRCKFSRLSFLRPTAELAKAPLSRWSSTLRTEGGGESKPSRRKPSRSELVFTSMVFTCSQASKELFFCQPPTAVTWPILMSSMRQVLQPSRPFRNSITSSDFGGCPSCTSHWARQTPK